MDQQFMSYAFVFILANREYYQYLSLVSLMGKSDIISLFCFSYLPDMFGSLLNVYELPILSGASGEMGRTESGHVWQGGRTALPLTSVRTAVHGGNKKQTGL